MGKHSVRNARKAPPVPVEEQPKAARPQLPIQPKAVDRCPACAGKQTQIDSKQRQGSLIIRYHRCLVCNCRFKTRDTVS